MLNYEKNHLCLFAYLLICLFAHQIVNAQNPDGFTCYFEPESGGVTTNSTIKSYNGKLHTPDGTLRLLIVYGGFEGWEGNSAAEPAQQTLGDWNNNISPDYQLPDYVILNPDGTVATDEFIFNDPDILQPNTVNPSTNISNVFYQMSRPNREFKVVADVFSGPDGLPRQVIIPQTATVNSWQNANRRVAEGMVEIWSDANGNITPEGIEYFSRFDQRTNGVNWDGSNVNSDRDGIIDFVVYLYRYDRGWNPQPRNGMANWFGSGGGYQGNNLTGNTDPIEGFEFQNGFVAPIGSNNQVLFNHEFAHAIYNAPHQCGVNGVSGPYFNFNMVGIGLTTGNDNTNISYPIMSAWERWYLQFINPIDPNGQDGVYTIGDYVATGDAMQIEIPFSDMNGGNKQRLWIQNNVGGHDLYTHRWAGRDLTPWGAPDPDPDHLLSDSNNGIYMYTENITNTHNFVNPFWSSSGQVKMINPMGNWDMTRLTTVDPTTNRWGARMYPFSYVEENPITGVNPWFAHRGDYGGPGRDCVDDEILFCGSLNGGGCPGGGPNNNACVSSVRNEFEVILREEVNGVYDHTYRQYGVDGGVESTAFLAGDKLSMGTNPTIINMAMYDEDTEQNESYYLNGLSVEILTNGPQAYVEVKYKQTAINEDVRWTGNVVLPNITENNQPDLDLAVGKQITIDVSGTAHRSTKHPVIDDFVNPSSFTISSGAKVLMRANSEILVKANSTLIIESGAEIDVRNKARIVVEPGGTLYLKGNAIDLMGTEAVIIMKGTLKTDTNVDFTFTGPGYASFYETHTLDLGVGSDFIIQRPSGNTDNRFLELRENTTLHIDDRNLDLLNGAVHYRDNSKILAEGKSVKYKGITARAIESSRTSTGIEGISNTVFEIEDSKFFELLMGAKYAGPTTIPLFVGNILKVCTRGFQVESVSTVFFIDNDLSYFIEAGVSIRDISRARFTDNFISGSNIGLVGVEAVTVRNIILDNTTVRKCREVGLRANSSNTTLRNGASIRDNDTGVFYYGNASANWFLAVGKCHCSSITNNNVGVSGDNIILEVDAEENQISCNLASLEHNNFNDNDIVFDICYTDPNYIPPSAILMKANYWGGGPLSNYQYSITKNDCQVNINVDDSNFSNTSCYQSTGGGGTIGVTENFGPQDESKVSYSYYDTGSLVEVHDIYRLAHTGYYNELIADTPVSQDTYLKYKRIATLDKNIHNDDKAVYKIDVSRCMVNAFDNNTIGDVANLNSSEEDRNTKKLETTLFEVYPNPATDRVWISTNSSEVYYLTIYNMIGEKINYQPFSGKTELTLESWPKGIYLIELRNEVGDFVKTKKVIIQ